jgi:hypothetical protein
MEVSSQLHAPAALSQGKEPRFPLEINWVGPRTGLDAVEKRKKLALPGIELDTDRVEPRIN